MKFGFIAKHRSVWPVAWLCEALGVSRSGFHAWLKRGPCARSREDEAIMPAVRASFVASARTYCAHRIWRDVVEAGFSCGLHKIERLMRAQALRARPRRRALPKDDGERSASAISPNVLDRQFTADQPNRKWIADFTYVWTAEGWLYVVAVIDLFSRRVDGFVEYAKRVSPTRLIHLDCSRYSVPASFANRPVSVRVYPERIVVAAEGRIIYEHRRVFARSHQRKSTTTVFDWRHYLAVIQRKPGALRNGAPFAELAPAFRALQQRMLKTPGGDRERVEACPRT